MNKNVIFNAAPTAECSVYKTLNLRRLFLYVGLTVVLVIMLILTSCASEADEGVKFGARSAYAISRHIGSDPETSPRTFTVNYAEFKIEDGFLNALIEATLFYPDQTFSRNVYQLSTGGEYYELLHNKGQAVFDEPTQLYMVNNGDAVINKQDEYKIDEKAVFEVFTKYINSGDLALIGLAPAE